MIEPFPLIDVSGTPYERGLQYGRQAAARIHLGASHYLGQVRALPRGEVSLEEAVRAYLPVIEAFEPTYIEEMQGIAAGAGIAFEHVMLINARTEVLKLAERGTPDASPTIETDGCTSLVVMPEASANGSLIHAQNWDWKRDCAETSVVLRVRNTDGPDILTFTEAGALGRAGFNSAGIAITGNYLESDRDYSQAGVPLALIRRKALEAEHLALAMRTVYVTGKSASSNMIVSHAGGVAINFECAPDETFLLHPENGVLVHANHWMNPSALAKLQDRGVGNMPDSLYRQTRVANALSQRPLTADDVRNALFDDFETPWSVCRPPRLSVKGVMMATVAMIVMEPASRRMHVAPLPALNREFTEYAL